MKKVIKFIIFGFAALCLILIAIGAVLYYFWSSNLPYIGSLKDYNPPIITEIFSSDGKVIGKYYDEKRIVVELEQVSKDLLNAIIASEDDQFYEHEGIDYPGIIRSFIKNFMATKIKGGGSTITQQMTRTVLLKDMTQTYKRKTREIILSLQIEKMFSKKRILFLFINEVYLGHGAYGVEAASQTYFGKNAKDLNLAECALIAGLYPAPSRYDPIFHFERAKERQKYVLRRMVEEGYITETQRKEAFNAPLVFGEKTDSVIKDSQCFTEYVRRYLEKQYGRDLLYRGGLKVYTTVNLDMQQWARKALGEGLSELDKREGYRGPIRSLTAEEMEKFSQETEEKLRLNPPEIGSVVQGVVDSVDDENIRAIITIGRESGILPLSEMKWARKPNPEVEYYAATVRRPGDVLKRGDVILCRIKEKMAPPYSWRVSLEQEPVIEGSVFVMEAKTGKVKAMIGGRDFTVSQFNRAIQSRRQPGSSFKPIIYSAALDSGMTPSTVILDTPYISTMNPDEEVWRPKNYRGNFLGPTLFRTGLIQSLNVITVKILKGVGVGNVIDYARRMGIESDLTPNLSLALGSSGVSLKEITTAYSVFVNRGLLVEPFFIERIEDRNGLILEEGQSSFRESISEDTAYVMTDLLKAVISEGTGQRIKALNRPAAGKTGTTNDLKDAWFIGFTPSLVTGVWVGYDDQKSMSKGETGARAASPIWLNFMSKALEGRPVEDFIAPESVVFAKIDKEQGLLASSYSKKTVFQAFKKGTEPREYTPRPKAAKSGQFPQFDMDFSE